jgi:hypothetical protein
VDILLIAFWLMPGYLFLWFWNKLVPYKRGSDWTYIAPIAVWSLVFFVLSRFIVLAFIESKKSCNLFENTIYFLRSQWSHYIPIAYSLSLAAASIISFTAGLVMYLILNFIIRKEKIWRDNSSGHFHSARYQVCLFVINLLKGFGYLNFPDFVSRQLYSLIEREIIIATKPGKFYIGTLISHSSDENENDKAIMISPIWSGYRDVKTHKVIFNTSYQDGQREGLELIFPLSSLISIGKFDHTLHQYFLKTGKTKIINKKFLKEKQK